MTKIILKNMSSFTLLLFAYLIYNDTSEDIVVISNGLIFVCGICYIYILNKIKPKLDDDAEKYVTELCKIIDELYSMKLRHNKLHNELNNENLKNILTININNTEIKSIIDKIIKLNTVDIENNNETLLSISKLNDDIEFIYKLYNNLESFNNIYEKNPKFVELDKSNLIETQINSTLQQLKEFFDNELKTKSNLIQQLKDFESILKSELDSLINVISNQNEELIVVFDYINILLYISKQHINENISIKNKNLNKILNSKLEYDDPPYDFMIIINYIFNLKNDTLDKKISLSKDQDSKYININSIYKLINRLLKDQFYKSNTDNNIIRFNKMLKSIIKENSSITIVDPESKKKN